MYRVWLSSGTRWCCARHPPSEAVLGDTSHLCVESCRIPEPVLGLWSCCEGPEIWLSLAWSPNEHLFLVLRGTSTERLGGEVGRGEGGEQDGIREGTQQKPLPCKPALQTQGRTLAGVSVWPWNLISSFSYLSSREQWWLVLSLYFTYNGIPFIWLQHCAIKCIS